MKRERGKKLILISGLKDSEVGSFVARNLELMQIFHLYELQLALLEHGTLTLVLNGDVW